MTDKSLVSVVIPTYNRIEKLKRLLNSILKSDYRDFEIIVIDDASSDGTYAEVKKLYPMVRLFRNSKPLLVSHCRNIGLWKSLGYFVFFVDDDNVVDSTTVSSLVETLTSQKDVAIVAPLMFYLNDPKRIWCAGVTRSLVTSKTTIRDQNICGKSHFDIIESEDFPNAFMVRKSIAKKLCGFDYKAFPIHYEEADFGARVRLNGYKIILNPQAKIWHDISVRTQNGGLLSSLHMTSAQRTFFVSRNRIIFMKKYAGALRFFLFCFLFYPALSTVYLGAILISKHRGIDKISFITAYLQGICSGLTWKN
jgi:hypothetical protein